MPDARRRAWSTLRIVKFLILLAVALGVAWVALRVTAVRAFPPQTGIGQRLDPGNPDALYRSAAQDILQNCGRLSAETYARVAEAARREPLAAEPFLFFGMRALEQGDVAGAERLLTEARRRNPRQRLARLVLLGTYLQTNRIAEASSEIAVLVRLVPRANDVLVPELARLAAAPATADAVVAAIGDDPLMAAVLARLAQQNVDPDHLLRLAARQPRTPEGGPPGWESIMLEAMVNRGDVRRARTLWQNRVGASGASSLVYDPRFEGRPGPPPFNWVLSASGPGVAERAPGGALELEYYGRASAALASQLLVLAPGRYRLAMRVEGSATGQGSRIEWQIACSRSGAGLATLPLRGVTYNPRDVAVEFTVPASGCDGQWLRAQGVAAEFPVTQAAKVSELTLQPAGGAQ